MMQPDDNEYSGMHSELCKDHICHPVEDTTLVDEQAFLEPIKIEVWKMIPNVTMPCVELWMV